MALGDKQYNYNYYNLPVTRTWTNTGDTEPFAAFVRPNIWGYWPDGIYYDDGQYANTDKNGKPLDDSIAVWRLPRNASFACNAFFSVDISSTLGAHYDVNVENNDVPLLCAAIDTTSTNWGKFDRKCVERYAYDTVNTCNGPMSALAYDINPTALCLHGFVITYDRATPATAPSGRTLTALANYIDGAPDTRDLVIIRPTIYRGTGDTRISTAETIPAFNPPYFDGILLADTSSKIPIPDGQTYLKSLIADTAGGHNYRSDAIYRPFASAYFYNLYNGANTNIYTYQLDIGFSRPFTKTQIISGAATISGSNKITAQLYRCNYGIKSFNDVEYQWENVIFDVTNKVELHNGFDLSLLSSSDSIRFYTRLKIIDPKGNTHGKALELAVKHELAYIGFYFADTQTRAESAVLGSAGDGVGVYLPEIIGGVTTGRYFTGEDIKSVPYADSNSVSDAAFHYDPGASEDDSGEFKSIIHSGRVEAGARYFAMTQAQADSVITYLNTTYQPDTIEQLTVDFKGSNPFDYFTTFKYYPFDIPVLSGAGAEVNVGPIDLGWKAAVLEYGYGIPGINYLNMGSVQLESKYRDFRDYQDTQIIVMLPWCGIVTLDPKLWLDHTLTVRYAIDFVTGTVTAYLLKDELIWDSANGKLGVDIPLSALANGTYQNEITNALYQLKQAENARMWAALGVAGGLIGTALSAATGNLVGAAGGIYGTIASVNKLNQVGEQIDNLEYKLDHTQPRMGVISSASPLNTCVEDRRVKVYIIRHKMLSGYDPQAYGKTIGFSCAKSGKLGDFKGFTKCAAIDLSGVPCSEAEKTMIKNICTKGVRV